jgi:tetratricopeptide (TPR) repeat protein
LLNSNTYSDNADEEKEPYPDYFIKWNSAARRGRVPSGLITPEEILDIIEIYLGEGYVDKARKAIEYAVALHHDYDILCDILDILDEYELWNDLLNLSSQLLDETGIDGECHKLSSLVHLGMEAEAFNWFGVLKKKYGGMGYEDRDMLSMAYIKMCEALLDIDLYESCDRVSCEAISVIGEDSDFLWLRMHSLVALNDKDTANIIAEKIQNLHPLSAEHWQNLGDAYQDLGEIEKAIDAYEFARSLGNESAENIMNLIFAYDENGNKGKALELIEEYFKDYKNSYIICVTAARLCIQLEQWKDAVRYLDVAIKVEPYTDDALYVYKATCHIHLDEPQKAKNALIKGIKKTGDISGKMKELLFQVNAKFP